MQSFSKKTDCVLSVTPKGRSRRGTDKVTMREIDREIAEYRKQKRL
jgi:hypothetical protein